MITFLRIITSVSLIASLSLPIFSCSKGKNPETGLSESAGSPTDETSDETSKTGVTGETVPEATKKQGEKVKKKEERANFDNAGFDEARFE